MERFLHKVDRLVVGDPIDDATNLGPLVSVAQRDRVHGFVDRARAAGAERRARRRAAGRPGRVLPADRDRRRSRKTPRSSRTRSSAQWCACSASPATTRRFAKANGTRYGLAASAWTRDVFRAQRAARELEAGTVWINEHLAIGSEMPHGGVKGSGFGKDMSMYALEEYTAIKHVVFELTGAPRKDWYDAVSTPEPT